jgi:hypothetical protein
MATETLIINAIDSAFSDPNGAVTDIDEAVADADGSSYGTTTENDVADFGLTTPTLIEDADTVNSVTITVRAKKGGTASNERFNVDLLIGGAVQGTQATTGNLTTSFANYTGINDTGWNSDWTLAQLTGMQVRLTAVQLGMAGTQVTDLDCIDVIVDFTEAAGDETVLPPKGDLTLTGYIPVTGPDFAINFDGVDDAIGIADIHDFDGTASFTVEIRMQADATQINAFGRLIAKTSSTDTGWDILVNDAAQRVEFGRDNVDGQEFASKAFVDDTPHHVAGVYDGTDLQVFVDGVGGTKVGSSRSLPTSTSLLRLGRPSTTPGVGEFTGILDEVRIWDHARTSAEINAYKKTRLTGSESGLVGLWRLNEGTRTTIKDKVSGGSDGTFSDGDPTWVVSPFPALESYVASPPKGDLTLTGYIPTITNESASGDKIVLPGKGDLTLTGYIPTLVQTFDHLLLPANGDLTLTGFLPTLVETDNKLAETPKGDLTLTGFLPVLAETDNKLAEPGNGDLTLTGFLPVLVETDNKLAEPDAYGLLAHARRDRQQACRDPQGRPNAYGVLANPDPDLRSPDFTSQR